MLLNNFHKKLYTLKWFIYILCLSLSNLLYEYILFLISIYAQTDFHFKCKTGSDYVNLSTECLKRKKNYVYQFKLNSQPIIGMWSSKHLKSKFFINKTPFIFFGCNILHIFIFLNEAISISHHTMEEKPSHPSWTMFCSMSNRTKAFSYCIALKTNKFHCILYVSSWWWSVWNC